MTPKQKALELVDELGALLNDAPAAKACHGYDARQILANLSVAIRENLPDGEPQPVETGERTDSPFCVGFLSGDGEVVGSLGATAPATAEPVWARFAAAIDFRAALQTVPHFGTARAHFETNGTLIGFTIDLND